MGPEYVSDLNQTNMLRELNKKLPLFRRIRWTECTETFERNRDALVNNAFEEDLTSISSKERESVKRRLRGVEFLRN